MEVADSDSLVVFGAIKMPVVPQIGSVLGFTSQAVDGKLPVLYMVEKVQWQVPFMTITERLTHMAELEAGKAEDAPMTCGARIYVRKIVRPAN